MSENAKALDLLNQLEHIFYSDPLIDEVGFVHPSQFATLKEAAGSSVSSQDALDNENTNFCNRDHKLRISTQVLIPLCKVAKHVFMAALTEYKTLGNLHGNSGDAALENEVVTHSKAVLMLSCDFGTAWNSRKLIVSKKQLLPIFMDELLVSALVLSYEPKSEWAWSHRQWVINMISGKCSVLQQIIDRESELVENIAERSKMNYHAWNHHCWLASYMTREQVLHQLEKSRSWASLHVADCSSLSLPQSASYKFSCPSLLSFVDLQRLMLGISEDLCHTQADHRSGYNFKIYDIWKEELDWNEGLIRRYIGREALWLHGRFLSSYWITHIAAELHGVSCQSGQESSADIDIDSFIGHELCLVDSCSTILDSEFEDFQAQATHSATYILWLTKQIPKSLGTNVEERIRARNLNRLLNTACPERSSFWNCLVDAEAFIG